MFENLKGILLFEFLQITHWKRQRFQLVDGEMKTIKRERWELKANERLNGVLGQICQLTNTVREWAQLVVAEIKPMKESDENWNQTIDPMPYMVRLVNWPIDSGKEVSWLCSRESLSKSDENWNQMTSWMPYSVKLVSWPIESGSEVSLLCSRSRLWKRDENWKSNDKSNAVLSQVSQLHNTVRQRGQLVVAEPKPIKETD
jgi:hypothetical protein